MARTAGGGCQSPGAPQAVLPALVVVVRNDAAANLPMTRATHSQVNHALQFHEPAIVRCSGIGLEMGGGERQPRLLRRSADFWWKVGRVK
jgi:hypothetical protein